MGSDRRPEVRDRAWICAAARRRRQNGAQRRRENPTLGSSRPFPMRSRDFGFRAATGAFACLLALVVVSIGFELFRQSWLSVQKFGFSFWTTSVWDPVAGQFGALPFIWGTLYSSILALLLATPVALGIAVFISELCPRALQTPLVFLTELLAAIPSIVYG